MRSIAACLIGAIALAACGQSERVDEVQPDTIAPDGIPPDVSDASAPADVETIPARGSADAGADDASANRWFSRTMVSGPAVLFGPPQSESQFLIRCEGSDLMFIRSARLPAGAVSMELEAGGESRTIRAQSWPQPTPQVAGRLGVGDPFAEHLASTTEPLEVRVEGISDLRMPSDEALRRLVADCDA